MINIKIIMPNKEYHIKNMVANNLKEFIKNVFMPMGTQLIWCEIIPKEFIQVDNIQSIKELSEEEMQKELFGEPKEEEIIDKEIEKSEETT